MKEKRAVGRPTFPRYEIPYMLERIDEYVNDYIINYSYEKGVPILKECCLLNRWNYTYFMELRTKHPELDDAANILLDWKEVLLEKGALQGKLDKTFVIFTLKQMGWSDKVQVNQDTTFTKLDDRIAAINADAENYAISDPTKKESDK